MRVVFTIIVRMSLCVVALMVLAFVLRERLVEVLLANVGINGIIVTVFLLGVLITFARVFGLRGEFLWIADFGRGDKRKAYKPKLLAGIATMLREKTNTSGRLVLSSSVTKTLLDGVSLRLEENRELNRYVVGVLVFLGLLGTFWGLMDTVGGVSRAIDALGVGVDDGEGGSGAIERLKESLEEPLGGMATAFSSSLLGLSGSLVVGFLAMQAEQAQNRFYNHVEEWLSSVTHFGSLGEQGAGHGAGLSGYTEALLEQMVDHLDSLQRALGKEHEQRREVSGGLMELSHRLGTMTDFMVAEQKLLQKLVDTLGGLHASGGSEDMVLAVKRLEKQLVNLEHVLSGGREALTEDIRREFRLLVRTLSSSLEGVSSQGSPLHGEEPPLRGE